MALADATRLHALSEELWRALGRRLKAIGFTARDTWPIHALAAEARSPVRAPLAKWHARRRSEPWAAAMRMLMLNDPVTDEEARAVLGDVPIERLFEASLLRRAEGDGVVSPYVMDNTGGCLFLCDDLAAGGDAVMGPGATTHDLIRATYPTEKVGSALDLACGAGTAAILLAPRCERVVATDVNARAITIARVNTWMNEVENVELRRGDLFAPVSGERFDLVVSQPPFVARADGAPTAAYLYGGARGDELPLRLMRELPAHLAPGGLAVLFVEWPMIDRDAPLEERLAAALGDGDASLLVVQTADVDYLDQHCAHYATQLRPERDDAWERLVLQRRDHFERFRVRYLRPSFTVVRRGAREAPRWRSVVESRSFVQASLTRARLDALVAARDLEATGSSALSRARLRIPSGVTFMKDGARHIASFGDDALNEPIYVEPVTASIVKLVHRTASVADAVRRFAATKRAPRMGAARILDEVKRALLAGLLEVPKARG